MQLSVVAGHSIHAVLRWRTVQVLHLVLHLEAIHRLLPKAHNVSER